MISCPETHGRTSASATQCLTADRLRLVRRRVEEEEVLGVARREDDAGDSARGRREAIAAAVAAVRLAPRGGAVAAGAHAHSPADACSPMFVALDPIQYAEDEVTTLPEQSSAAPRTRLRPRSLCEAPAEQLSGGPVSPAPQNILRRAQEL